MDTRPTRSKASRLPRYLKEFVRLEEHDGFETTYISTIRFFGLPNSTRASVPKSGLE